MRPHEQILYSAKLPRWFLESKKNYWVNGPHGGPGVREQNVIARSEATRQSCNRTGLTDCFVASLLAMTDMFVISIPSEGFTLAISWI
jgi:hypothetical protein